MDKQTVVYSYNSIPFSNMKGKTTDKSSNMADSHRHDVKMSECCQTQKNLYCCFPFLWSAWTGKTNQGDRNQNTGCLWGGFAWEGRRDLYWCSGNMHVTFKIHWPVHFISIHFTMCKLNLHLKVSNVNEISGWFRQPLAWHEAWRQSCLLL